MIFKKSKINNKRNNYKYKDRYVREEWKKTNSSKKRMIFWINGLNILKKLSILMKNFEEFINHMKNLL